MHAPRVKTGRPSRPEVRRRTREFIRQLSHGASVARAQQLSGIPDAGIVRLLDEPEFQAVAHAILDGRLGPTVVVLDPAVGEAA